MGAGQDTHIAKYSEAITASLRLYSSALDTSDYSNAFLSLWQCIELLTMLSNENYKMTDVVERILCLNDFKDPVTKYFINLSADRRNNLVHKGIFDNIEGQSEVQLLKSVARSCILNYLKKIKQYKSFDELEYFYRFAKLPEQNISTIRNVVDTLLNKPIE